MCLRAHASDRMLSNLFYIFSYFLCNEVLGPAYIFPSVISSASSIQRVISSQAPSEACVSYAVMWPLELLLLGLSFIGLIMESLISWLHFLSRQNNLYSNVSELTLCVFSCLVVFTFSKATIIFSDANCDLHIISTVGKLQPVGQIQQLLFLANKVLWEHSHTHLFKYYVW